MALSWVSLGQLLFALGRLLTSLGFFLNVSWALLGRSWLSLGCSVELQGRIWAPSTVPGLDFGGFGNVPDWVLKGSQSSLAVLFATPRLSSHNALKNAMTTLGHLLRLFVSPLQRGGTCEAHGIQSFGSMCPKSFPRASEVAPQRPQGGTKGRFSKDFR